MKPADVLTVGVLREMTAGLADDAPVMVGVDGSSVAWARLAVRDPGAGALDVYGGTTEAGLRALADEQLADLRAARLGVPLTVSTVRGWPVASARAADHVVLLRGERRGSLGSVTDPWLDDDGRIGVLWSGAATAVRVDPATVGLYGKG